MKTKDIVIIGLFSSILFSIQVGLAFLPNVELVTLLIMIYTITLRKKAFYIITVFILLEGIFYGFGLWWINYLYIWYILFFITMVFRKERSSLLWAMIAGAYGLFFGALCSIPYFFIGGFQTAFAYWISGIPFDLAHGLANFLITLLLFKPLTRIIDELKSSYAFSSNDY